VKKKVKRRSQTSFCPE